MVRHGARRASSSSMWYISLPVIDNMVFDFSRARIPKNSRQQINTKEGATTEQTLLESRKQVEDLSSEAGHFLWG